MFNYIFILIFSEFVYNRLFAVFQSYTNNFFTFVWFHVLLLINETITQSCNFKKVFLFNDNINNSNNDSDTTYNWCTRNNNKRIDKIG